MENNEMFFVDVLRIFPDELDCFIGTYDIDDSIALSLMNDINDSIFDKYIHLNQQNKNLFIERLTKATIVEYFQVLEIKKDSFLLFRGYDGIESGSISNTIIIPDWFKQKYKENWTYTISKDW